jgi:multisubunit Na+/H+ antiporter MnhG subunit
MINQHKHQHAENASSSTLSKAKVVLVGFLIVAAYFLITEHRAHLGGALYYLPFLLLLACLLMHIFMHSGHSEHVPENRPGDNQKGDA